MRCCSVLLKSTSTAEYVFSSRVITIPVRFHSRKRRLFFIGVDDGYSTSCAAAPTGIAASAAAALPRAPAPPPADLRPSNAWPTARGPWSLSCSASSAASAASSSSWSEKPPSSESWSTFRSRRRPPPAAPSASASSSTTASSSSSAAFAGLSPSAAPAAPVGSAAAAADGSTAAAAAGATGAARAPSASPTGEGRWVGTGFCHVPSWPASSMNDTVLSRGDHARSQQPACEARGWGW